MLLVSLGVGLVLAAVLVWVLRCDASKPATTAAMPMAAHACIRLPPKC